MHPALRQAYQRARNSRIDISTGVVVPPKPAPVVRIIVPAEPKIKPIPRRHRAKMQTYRPRFDADYERAWCQIICGVTPLERQLMVTADRRRLTLIAEVVRENFGFSKVAFLADRRHRDLTHARHVAMYLAKKYTRCSFPEIARWLNKSDHSTIWHGIRVIEKKRESDPDLAARIEMLERRLNFNGGSNAVA